MAAPGLFGSDLPAGFRYQRDFISEQQEAALVDDIGGLDFADFTMRGVVARRRVAFFGQSYDRTPAGPIPDFIRPLRARVAAWARLPEEVFAMVLINEYRPGAPIGWHRDAPQYDVVAGVSLLSDARMKFRPYVPPAEAASSRGPRVATHQLVLERRSAYLMTDASRNAYEHHIPPVAHLRYSITFRSLR